VEGAHRELGPRFAYALGGDCTDGLAQQHWFAGRQAPAIAEAANPPPCTTGQRRTHANALDAQFDDQAGRFLQAPRKFRIDRAKKEVHLSSIFKWFGEDFVRNYGTDKAFAGHKDSERAVLSHISKHVGEQDRNYLVNERYKIKYLDYDWTLNEQ